MACYLTNTYFTVICVVVKSWSVCSYQTKKPVWLIPKTIFWTVNTSTTVSFVLWIFNIYTSATVFKPFACNAVEANYTINPFNTTFFSFCGMSAKRRPYLIYQNCFLSNRKGISHLFEIIVQWVCINTDPVLMLYCYRLQNNVCFSAYEAHIVVTSFQ